MEDLPIKQFLEDLKGPSRVCIKGTVKEILAGNDVVPQHPDKVVAILNEYFNATRTEQDNQGEDDQQ